MSAREHYLKILRGASAAGTAAFSVLLATAAVPAEADQPAAAPEASRGSASVADRLAAIRDAVSDLNAAPQSAAHAPPPDQLAWGWSNWHNWSNWSNWHNWSNWGNAAAVGQAIQGVGQAIQGMIPPPAPPPAEGEAPAAPPEEGAAPVAAVPPVPVPESPACGPLANQENAMINEINEQNRTRMIAAGLPQTYGQVALQLSCQEAEVLRWKSGEMHRLVAFEQSSSATCPVRFNASVISQNTAKMNEVDQFLQRFTQQCAQYTAQAAVPPPAVVAGQPQVSPGDVVNAVGNVVQAVTPPPPPPDAPPPAAAPAPTSAPSGGGSEDHARALSDQGDQLVKQGQCTAAAKLYGQAAAESTLYRDLYADRQRKAAAGNFAGCP